MSQSLVVRKEVSSHNPTVYTYRMVSLSNLVDLSLILKSSINKARSRPLDSSCKANIAGPKLNIRNFPHCYTTNGNYMLLYVRKYSQNLLVYADATSQQWLVCSTRRASWRQTKLQPIGNEWMRSTVILDHPGPDWGKSQTCLCASPILFSYPDTLMPVMQGKQSGPADIILTRSCVNNSAWLRGGLRRQSHILNVRDTVLAFMNPRIWLTELCSEKLLEITQCASARKLLWNDPIIMQTAVCILHLCVCVCVYILLGCVHV